MVVCRSHLTCYWQMFTAFSLFVVRSWKGSWSLQQRMGPRRNTSHRSTAEVYRGNIGMEISTLEEIACDLCCKMTVHFKCAGGIRVESLLNLLRSGKYAKKSRDWALLVRLCFKELSAQTTLIPARQLTLSRSSPLSFHPDKAAQSKYS
jgi:hypothetical protein